jgi:hypothetical protein
MFGCRSGLQSHDCHGDRDAALDGSQEVVEAAEPAVASTSDSVADGDTQLKAATPATARETTVFTARKER